MYGYYVLLTSWINLGERLETCANLVKDYCWKTLRWGSERQYFYIYLFTFLEEALCPSTFIDTPPQHHPYRAQHNQVSFFRALQKK